MNREIITEALKAAKGGDQETIERIVSDGFSVNRTDEHGFTLLMEAAASGVRITRVSP